LCIAEKQLECCHAFAVDPVEIYVGIGYGRKHVTTLSGARDQYVQSPFAALAAEGPEVHAYFTVSGFSVPNGNQNDVPLVALNILQVFDKERLMRLSRKKSFGCRFRSSQEFDLVQNGASLRNGKRSNPQALIRVLTCMLHDRGCNLPCFNDVRARIPRIVDSIAYIMEAQASSGFGRIWAWKNAQSVFIEFPVRNGYQGLVFTSVMPKQRPFGYASREKEPKNTLEISYLCRLVLVIFGLRPGYSGKESRRRQLLLVPNNHCLSASGNGSQSVNRLDLTGFIHHEQIEMHLARWKKLSNGEGAHHENGFERLNGRPGMRH